MTPPAGLRAALRRLARLLSDEDDPAVPHYDPVHLAATLVVCMAAIGMLYWLLWTLLVYEGGIQTKVAAALKVLLTSATLKDVGYEGRPYAQGAFEGWLGNLLALVLLTALVAAGRRLLQRPAGRQP